MTLSRKEVVEGLIQELESFGQLIGPLEAAAWAAPTRCEGWSVADVSAHVVGTMADVVGGRLDDLGSPEVTAREVAERRGRVPAEVAAELAQVATVTAELGAAFDDEAWAAPAPGGYDGSLGDGVETLWYDAYLHGEDIRAALGQKPARGAGLRPSVHHVARILGQRGWGPATLSFHDVDTVTVGRGGGPSFTGDALAFVLAATGRADPGELGLDATVNIYG
jgi:uncharacterized protein (TIGR03083 family)